MPNLCGNQWSAAVRPPAKLINVFASLLTIIPRNSVTIIALLHLSSEGHCLLSAVKVWWAVIYCRVHVCLRTNYRWLILREIPRKYDGFGGRLMLTVEPEPGNLWVPLSGQVLNICCKIIFWFQIMMLVCIYIYIYIYQIDTVMQTEGELVYLFLYLLVL